MADLVDFANKKDIVSSGDLQLIERYFLENHGLANREYIRYNSDTEFGYYDAKRDIVTYNESALDKDARMYVGYLFNRYIGLSGYEKILLNYRKCYQVYYALMHVLMSARKDDYNPNLSRAINEVLYDMCMEKTGGIVTFNPSTKNEGEQVSFNNDQNSLLPIEMVASSLASREALNLFKCSHLPNDNLKVLSHAQLVYIFEKYMENTSPFEETFDGEDSDDGIKSMFMKASVTGRFDAGLPLSSPELSRIDTRIKQEGKKIYIKKR